jgi:hypothetical protein
MNRTMKLVLAGAAAAVGVVLVAVAQTPPTAAPATVPAVVPAPAVPKATPTAQTAAPVVASPERFEPTDKVRADFDVSFPIDI